MMLSIHPLPNKPMYIPTKSNKMNLMREKSVV